MEKIKVVMDTLDVEELLLSFTKDYSPSKVKIIEKEDKFGVDILIIQDMKEYEDRIYGRKIRDKYYFARFEHVDKSYPDIDYYDEFFSNGSVIL